MTRLPRAAVAAVLLTLAAATGARADTAAATLTFADGSAEPATVEVPAGQEVELVVKNAGKTPAEFESHTLHIEKVVAPGAELKLKLKLPAGSYPFVDDFHAAARGVVVAK